MSRLTSLGTIAVSGVLPMCPFLFLLVTSSVFVVSCDSAKPDEENEVLEFQLEGNLDGEPWMADESRAIVTISKDGSESERITNLSIIGTVGDRSRPCPPWDICETISLGVSLHEDPVNEYPGNPNASFSFADGDAIAGLYETHSEEGGFVRIEVFNEVDEYIEGVFEAVLVKTHDAGPPYGPFPDTLRFTEGRFEGYFENRLTGSLRAVHPDATDPR